MYCTDVAGFFIQIQAVLTEQLLTIKAAPEDVYVYIGYYIKNSRIC
jgi:hypothetical protein